MWDNIWIKKLLLSTVVGILFTIFILWYINVYIFNSKAGLLFNPVEFFRTLTQQNAPPLTVLFTPQQRSVKVGESFNYIVAMESSKADQKVSGFDLTFTYDPKLVEYAGVSAVSDSATAAGLNTSSSASAPAGTLPSTDAAGSVGAGGAPGTAGSAGAVVGTGGTGAGTGGAVGTATGRALPGGTLPSSDAAGAAGGPGGAAGAAGGAPGTAATSALATLGAPVTEYEKVIDKVDPVAGTVRITYAGKLADDALLAKPAFTLTFKAKAVGTGEVGINKGDATGTPDEIFDVVKDATADYVISAGDGGDGEGTGKVKLDLTVKFYGVQQVPATVTSLPVKVSIGGGALTAPVARTVTFTLANKIEEQTNHQLWHGVGNFDVPAGNDYTLYIKGPLHLQKKIGDADPSDVNDKGEVLPGYYQSRKGSISLKEDINTFVFSGMMLMAGDVPVQDNIVNSGDLIACRTHMNETDETGTGICDINLDGAVNGIDYALVIKGLDFRRDEL